MSRFRNIVALLMILSTKSAFAGSGRWTEAQERQAHDAEVVDAISVLVDAGIIEVQGSEIVVKHPSAFEQLQQEGRVDQYDVRSATICLKGN